MLYKSKPRYLLRRTASHAQVIDKLGLLMLIVNVLAIDKTIVLHAIRSPFKDFEDALQNYAP